MATKLLDEWIAAATQNPILTLGKHTSVVAKIKYLLGMAVMFLLSSLILYPLLYPVDQPLKLSLNAVDAETAEPKKMINPRFHGIDKFNRPFNVRADEAFQKSDIIVQLKNINGDMALESGQWAMVEATSGEITTDSGQLLLSEGVKIFSSDGYEIKAIDAKIDLNAATAKSEKTIIVQGPIGLLEGKGFFLDVNEQRLNLTGRVMLTIYPNNK
jgi:lipopolysaccharide export system protein LptC